MRSALPFDPNTSPPQRVKRPKLEKSHAEEVVKGRDVTIRFDANRCIHSRGCVLGHPEVYVPNVHGEWIHPDAASADTVMLTALNCPSGAIRVARNTARPIRMHHRSSTPFGCARMAPFAIEADLSIRGQAQATPRATFCRCGQSQKKPFCDGAHASASFAATGEPATNYFTDLEIRNGLVNVQPLPNGPLLMTGNLEIVSGTGRTTDKVTRIALCRCGQSKNKPYCDGSGLMRLSPLRPVAARPLSARCSLWRDTDMLFARRGSLRRPAKYCGLAFDYNSLSWRCVRAKRRIRP
jgi:CDGSH-type Zn-finger protein/uncharacterized Fe-S cluster protein YjdI